MARGQRIRDNEVLLSGRRVEILHEIVKGHDTYTTLKDALNIGAGTVQYHLEMLEGGGILGSEKRGARRHYRILPPYDKKIPAS